VDAAIILLQSLKSAQKNYFFKKSKVAKKRVKDKNQKLVWLKEFDGTYLEGNAMF
jgi:hypothetical protein